MITGIAIMLFGFVMFYCGVLNERAQRQHRPRFEPRQPRLLQLAEQQKEIA